jgi:hypothetical protein
MANHADCGRIARALAPAHLDRALAEPIPRQHRPTCVADGVHDVPQEDAGVATELRVLAALYEAGKRGLP